MNKWYNNYIAAKANVYTFDLIWFDFMVPDASALVPVVYVMATWPILAGSACRMTGSPDSGMKTILYGKLRISSPKYQSRVQSSV